jgi:hypothetical protein
MHTRLKPMQTPKFHPSRSPPSDPHASRLCLSGELGLAVGDLNTKLLSAGDDGNSVLGRDGVRNPG